MKLNYYFLLLGLIFSQHVLGQGLSDSEFQLLFKQPYLSVNELMEKTGLGQTFDLTTEPDWCDYIEEGCEDEGQFLLWKPDSVIRLWSKEKQQKFYAFKKDSEDYAESYKKRKKIFGRDQVISKRIQRPMGGDFQETYLDVVSMNGNRRSIGIHILTEGDSILPILPQVFLGSQNCLIELSLRMFVVIRLN